MIKRYKTPKTEKDDWLSKNHNHEVKYRKRLQEDSEKEQELKEFLTNAETEIQDYIRRDDLSHQVRSGTK
jgi:hypothetical protein